MKPRVLLIEDDVWLADSYQDVLEEYDVDIAQNAQDAMDNIDSYDYDVVIADVMLERGLIIDLLHELQSYDDTAKLPIILCTSLAQRLLLDDVKPYGVVQILDKTTLTPKLLREAIEHNLRDEPI